MHSSISNSNTRLPKAPYKALLLLTAFISILMVSGAEFYWRMQGQIPVITDDKDLWSYWRSKVYSSNNKNVLVIIGASRAQLGLVPEVISKHFNKHNVIMLAIDGRHPYEVLKHLANDDEFNGKVIVSILIGTLYDDSQRSQKEWCSYYDSNWTTLIRYGKQIELWLRTLVQNKFVVLNSNLSLKRQFISAFKIKPAYLSMYKTRYRPAYYERMEKDDLINHRNERIEGAYQKYKDGNAYNNEKEFYSFLTKKIKPLVNKIQSRGGNVMFIRMPTPPLSELRKDVIDLYPKNIYWDKISELTGAQTIHFNDYKELSGFNLPDASHLNADDAVTFTEKLCIILRSN